MAGTYTIDQVKPELLTLDTVRERLATTEPFESLTIPAGDNVWFYLKEGWNHALNAKEPEDVVDVELEVKNVGKYSLTKEALLEATSLAKLPEGFPTTYPASVVEDALNWWYREKQQGKEYKAFSLNGQIKAVTRGTIVPFSNLSLLDSVLEGIEKKYGKGEVFADFKMDHSLKNTNVRLIIPEKTRVIENTGLDSDTWSAGIQIKNSLIGSVQTSLSGYMFRYWCLNGALEHHKAKAWNRKSEGQDPTDAYNWARNEVDAILDGLEESFDNVQAMTEISVEGIASSVLTHIYDSYKIPYKLRKHVDNNVIMSDQLTMYSLMQAVTSLANSWEIDELTRDRLIMIGGELMHQPHDTCDRGYIH